MRAVAVLVANPDSHPLDERVVREVGHAVKCIPCWLSAGEAAEFAIEDFQPRQAGAAVSEILSGLPVDHAILPAEGRRKRLLVADMDSTIITIECIDELADFAGIKPQIAAVTRRAMNGEIDFKDAIRERVALLVGLPAGVIEEVIKDRLHIMPGARTLVQTMRKNGAYTALVSGGFTGFTSHVRRCVGFDLDEANELEVADGRLTGKLVDPLRDSSSKLATLERLRAELGLGRQDIVAVGDGANDLPMIQAAGLGVAFRAHPRVKAASPVSIEHGDLTALLYLQGYRRGDFVQA